MIDGVTKNCILEDSEIAKLDGIIAVLSKSAIDNGSLKATLQKYQAERLAIKQQFVRNNCVDKLEQYKTLESADVLSRGYSQTEEDLLKKSNKQKNQLLLLGGGVLLLGLYIIIK